MSKEQKNAPISVEDVFVGARRAAQLQAEGDKWDNCYKNCVDAGGDREKCWQFCYKDFNTVVMPTGGTTTH